MSSCGGFLNVIVNDPSIKISSWSLQLGTRHEMRIDKIKKNMYFIRHYFYKFFGKESWNVFIIVEVAPPSNGFISTVKRTPNFKSSGKS